MREHSTIFLGITVVPTFFQIKTAVLPSHGRHQPAPGWRQVLQDPEGSTTRGLWRKHNSQWYRHFVYGRGNSVQQHCWCDRVEWWAGGEGRGFNFDWMGDHFCKYKRVYYENIKRANNPRLKSSTLQCHSCLRRQTTYGVAESIIKGATIEVL